MTLLATERIKLFSTRSPWWCALIAIALPVGFGAIVVGNVAARSSATIANAEAGYAFGAPVIMVLATLAVTTEYRFNTIRTTFQAVPNRTAVLLAKTGVVALLALVIGEICGFGAWGISNLIAPDANLALSTGGDWTRVAGIGVVYALYAVIAVSVGILIRHSAGAISLLLIYALAAENLIQVIPTIGDKIHPWLPYNMADSFVTGSGAGANQGQPLSDAALGSGAALAYFAGFAAVLFVISIVVANRRDA